MNRSISKRFILPCRVFFLFLGLGIFNQAIAEDANIGGIVVNKTISWFGQDFYYYFAREWRNQRNSDKHQILVEEIPSARKGTQIIIRYKSNIVFQTAINGTRSSSRRSGEDAVARVLANVDNIDIAASGYQDEDLGKDEF